MFAAAGIVLAAALAWCSLNMSAGILNSLPTIRVNGHVMYYYDTQAGDNLYSVADKLGVTIEEIRANNPSASEGIKPKMRLYFPSDIATSQKGNSAGPLTHVVQKGESVYGIARKYGYSVDELMALNPKAEHGIRPGDRLTLPAAEAAAAETPAVETPVAAAPVVDTPVEETPVAAAPVVETPVAAAPVVDTPAVEAPAAETPVVVAVGSVTNAPDVTECEVPTDSAIPAGTAIPAEVVPADSIDIALMLPFLLNEEQVGRQTQLYTEFYKGFVMAADTLNRPGQVQVRLHVYDTCASLDSVRAIMSRPEMKDVDFIIGPDNVDQLRAISEKAPEDILVYNVFAVKDDAYLTDRDMCQLNIPHEQMYQAAIEGFLEQYPLAETVFLQRSAGKADKDEFVKALKDRLAQEQRPFRTITFSDNLTDSDLEGLDPNVFSYVFVPLSGNRDEFSRIYPALKQLKEKADLSPELVQLFGYPEYATFRGAQFDDICQLQTTIYSRYFPTGNDAEARAFAARFKEMYNTELPDNQMPVLGILGFDTGMMAINWAREEKSTGEMPVDFSGIQSGIRLKRAGENGGQYNDSLFIITYRPGGVIEKHQR